MCMGYTDIRKHMDLEAYGGMEVYRYMGADQHIRSVQTYGVMWT